MQESVRLSRFGRDRGSHLERLAGPSRHCSIDERLMIINRSSNDVRAPADRPRNAEARIDRVLSVTNGAGRGSFRKINTDPKIIKLDRLDGNFSIMTFAQFRPAKMLNVSAKIRSSHSGIP